MVDNVGDVLFALVSILCRCHVAGAIPKEIGALVELQGLDVGNNELTGESTWSCTRLRAFGVGWLSNLRFYFASRPLFYGLCDRNAETNEWWTQVESAIVIFVVFLMWRRMLVRGCESGVNGSDAVAVAEPERVRCHIIGVSFGDDHVAVED